MAPPDYIVDIEGLRPGARASRWKTGNTARPVRGSGGGGKSGDGSAGAQGRPWLAIHWKCCGAYSRIYRDRSGGFYAGRCPRCGRPVKVPIGPGGTSARFFEAT